MKIAEVSEEQVLVTLARAVPVTEEVVQVGASLDYAPAWQDVSPGEVSPGRVGLLHLGPGRHADFELWQPLLVKGAIILMEDYVPDGETYNHAIDLAARGYITSLSEARHWKGLGVATFLGGGKS